MILYFCDTKKYHKTLRVSHIMETKVKIVFDRKKTASKTSSGTVEIEIYQNRKRKWISTGVRVFLHQWKNGMVVNREDAPILNTQIHKQYQNILQITDRHIAIESVDRVHLCRANFLDWLDEQVEERMVRESTREQHRVMARSIRESGLFSTFDDLTERNITLWDISLKKKLRMQSSVHGYHKRLKPYIGLAKQLGYIATNPYEYLKIPKGKSESRKFISEEERTSIEMLPLTGGMAKVRDMFIFSCYTGLADADLRKVSREDIVIEDGNSYIVDKRLKTGTGYKLQILPKAKEILERYDYNLDLISNQKCNMFLKAIQAMAGIKTNLTMHVARHTFATWALKRGVPIEIVSKMLAHTDICTTQIYAKVLQEEVTKGFELLR